MTRSWLLTGVVVVALIPVSFGTITGIFEITDNCLHVIFPEQRGVDGAVEREGWPEIARKFVENYFGASRAVAVFATELVDLLPLLAVCAALGMLRLRSANVIAWSVVATLVVMLPALDLMERGKLGSVRDYIMAGLTGCICLGGWWLARIASKRWIYARFPENAKAGTKRKTIYAVLAIALALVSIYGWLMWTVFFNFGDAFKDMKWMIM